MQPESHYNLNKLHVIFAVVSLILLGALGGLVAKDYSRSWKKHQRDFRALEVEKTRVKLDAVTNELDANDEYKALVEEIKEAHKAFVQNCSRNNEETKKAEKYSTENTLVSQDLKFAQAELDAARFRFEEAQGTHKPNLSKARDDYQALKKKVAALTLQKDASAQSLEQAQRRIRSCGEQLSALKQKERRLTQQTQLFKRKLKKIDPNEMGMVDQLAEIIRDLPIIDLSNPNYKIDQIVLSDIKDDVNLKLVPKVDRCTTCHKGIATPGYEEVNQPLTTHPNLQLFLANDSPHPLEEFGCTACHSGRGRGTDFTSAAHTPDSEEQAEAWHKKYGWKEMEQWDKPMFPLANTEAGCFKCHSGQTTIKGAEKLNTGLHIIERAGCSQCHEIKKYKDWPKPGPSLNKIAAKSTKQWLYRWIEDPYAIRKDTWMPAFFHQSNNADVVSVIREQQEIHAIVEYLQQNSAPFTLEKPPVKGDAKRGEELVSSLGCLACHQMGPNPAGTATTADVLNRQQGPSLIGLGSKTTMAWIYNWLKDPQRYHAGTMMPNLRLSNQEAADIASFLTSERDVRLNRINMPPVDEKIVDRITRDFLLKNFTKQQSDARLASMKLNDKLLFVGERLIGRYGCYACHEIKGFEGAKPIGTELTEEGSKALHKFDFGYIHIEHSKPSWFRQKLKDPRIFDSAKVKATLDKAIMPNYRFSDEEIDAVTTALLGFVSNTTVIEKQKPRTWDNLAIEEGQTIVRKYNCQGCHEIEEQGATIQKNVTDWLVKYEGRTQADADAIVKSFSPPNLIGEGKKVKTQWLFNFLHSPTPIRPWLKVRMPTYHLTAAETNALIRYFNLLDGSSFPFESKVDIHLSGSEHQDAEKLFSNDYFGCAKCHIIGDNLPGGSPDSWAPNFALANERLRPEWIIEWLIDPQRLLPGTKMPTYFDPSSFDISGPEDILNGDEHEQIRVLRNYLMILEKNSEVTNPAVAAPNTAL